VLWETHGRWHLQILTTISFMSSGCCRKSSFKKFIKFNTYFLGRGLTSTKIILIHEVLEEVSNAIISIKSIDDTGDETHR
jgi:hypothetical protein